eukprot:TRINITY_DN72162_c0_g1_i1.p1 TRINITY_DN72162_c0_g1~~TRINITY_DN72162_c0_g1_i1.p1  ORF type:complete len:684 (-),score=115.35 TRINITY_DN72162_c0_g1_i1:20-2071(-)
MPKSVCCLKVLVPYFVFCSLRWTALEARKIRHKTSSKLSAQAQQATKTPGCADLTNHDTHYTLEARVGSPAQKFSLIVDTGSNNIIIPSCYCQEQMSCDRRDRCFLGTNKSSTFFIQKDFNKIPRVSIQFGSGRIDSVVSTDDVSIGGINARMGDSLLLMTSKALKFEGSFEGLLGMGLPHSEIKTSAAPGGDGGQDVDPNEALRKIIEAMGGGGGGGADPGMGAGGAPMPAAGVDEQTAAQIAALMPPEAGQGSSLIQQSATNHPQVRRPSDLKWARRETGKSKRAYARRLPAASSASQETLSNELEENGDGDANDPTANAAAAAQPEKAQPQAGAAAAKAEDGAGGSPGETESQDAPGVVNPKGFAEAADLDGFSMCFNHGADGVLLLNPPKGKHVLGSIGKGHWGLDFHGISIGEASKEVEFCSSKDKKEGQDTACGIIPDSGTTLILGPQDQVTKLYESLCSQWDRCRNNHTALQKGMAAASEEITKNYGLDPFNLAQKIPSQAQMFLKLLAECDTWRHEDRFFEQLPPLHFHVAGHDGTRISLEMPAASWIMEQDVPDLQRMQGGNSQEINPRFLQFFEMQPAAQKVCMPMIDVMDYNTKANGPVWIFGLPLFSEYHVGYNLKPQPAEISFTAINDDCSKCGTSSLLMEEKETRSRQRVLRKIRGPPRRPSIDTSRPL